jgi:hypothetical protein
MIKLNIATGIQGIKSIREANKRGWHVFDENGHLEFSPEAFVFTVKSWNDKGYQLIDVTGNGLSVRKI